MTLYIISELLKKPSVAFKKISQNPQYFPLGIVLFSLSIFVSFFDSISALFLQMPYGLVEFPNQVYHAVNFGGIVLSHFIIIVIIFYAGKHTGGSTNFKQVFSVLSFCLIPTIIGVVITMSTGMAFSFLVSPPSDELSPSYALDFVSGTLVNFTIVLFFIWSLILYVKAIKITNNFSALRSVLLLLFAIFAVQFVSMMYNFGTSIPLQVLFSS